MSNRDYAQKKYLKEYDSSDTKPRGRIKRAITKAGRQNAKHKIRKEIENVEDIDTDIDYSFSE